VAAKDSSASCVLVLLEGKVLAPCQPWISQQLPKHLACWSLEQPDILLPITILLQIDLPGHLPLSLPSAARACRDPRHLDQSLGGVVLFR